jgi:hypothetical protein
MVNIVITLGRRHREAASAASRPINLLSKRLATSIIGYSEDEFKLLTSFPDRAPPQQAYSAEFLAAGVCALAGLAMTIWSLSGATL